MIILTLPNEVIQRIAFWSASIDYTGPLTDLRALVLTCHAIHDIILGTPTHPQFAVLASIARFRYSTSAPLRRLGPDAVTNSHVAMELTIRVPALRRVRLCEVIGRHLVADLWVVLHMCIEDDGHNIEQLDYVQAEHWVSVITNLRIPWDQVDYYLWPLATHITQLAVFIYSLLATRTSRPVRYLTIGSHTNHPRETLSHYALAGQRYEVSHLPESLPLVNNYCLREFFDLQPDHMLPTRNDTYSSAGRVSDTHTPPPVTLPNPLWGHIVHMSLPRIVVSSILSLYPGWTNVTRTDRNSDRICALDSRRFDADYWRLVLSHIGVTKYAIWPRVPEQDPESQRSALFVAQMISFTPPSTREVGTLARFMFMPPPDTDARLSSCWFGLGRLWAPGLLTGVWKGECLSMSLDWYASMLDADPLRPQFPFGDGSVRPTSYRLVLRMREHVTTGAKAKFPPLRNLESLGGWFHAPMNYLGQTGVGTPEGGVSCMYERNGKLVIHDTLEPDSKLALKYYNTVMIGKGLDFPDNHSIGYDGYGVDVPLPPPGPLPIFPSAIKKSPRRRSATSLDAPGDSANGRPSGSGSNVGHSNASGPSRHYSTPGPSCHSNAPGPSRPSNAPGPSTSRTAATNTIQSNSEYVSTQPTDIDALLNEALENEKSYVTSMGREDGDGKVDVIITGEFQEFDFLHPAGKEARRIYGRIRRNDGFVVFVRVPTSDEPACIVFRGYVVGGSALVGRWREATKDFTARPFEGTFMMTKITTT